MELGIDVGDLDHVIQLDAPSSVASLLQRLGRTGRRAGTRANGTFFCVSPESLLQSSPFCASPKRAGSRTCVRRRRPCMSWPTRSWPWCFRRAASPDTGSALGSWRPTVLGRARRAVSRAGRHHGPAADSYEADGLLSLGHAGRALYGRKNFFELYAVFTAPPVMRVVHGKDEIGYVQALFVSLHDGSEGPLCFRLSGRAWEVVQVDWGRGVLRRSSGRGRSGAYLAGPAGRALARPSARRCWTSSCARPMRPSG